VTVSSPPRLRLATAADLPAMASLHRRAYSRGHFLALLPESVLEDYYARFLGDGSQAVVAALVDGSPTSEGGGEVVGFAVFGRNIEERIARFKQNHRAVIACTALGHPLLAAHRLFSAIRSPSPCAGRVPAPALLLSIAVGEPGRGLGRLLLEETLRRCMQDGEERIGLYVRHDNITAVNAYIQVGFRIADSIADQYYMERRLTTALSAGIG
jgi:ribosomal protein S18 acetylase RimI-like enzyme